MEWALFANLHIIQAHIFGQRIWDNLWLYHGNIFYAHSWVHLGYMLTHLIVWVEFSFVTLFIIIFYLGIPKSQGTSLRFILISLISCEASQSLFYLFIYCSGLLWLAHQQKGIWNFEQLPSPKIEVTLFYTIV